ncbi:MAG: substrate-binding domain-containing protein [Gammaproteobacteria bacterium]|nr:substrate-binding domain-containing protein [Gammaproteobacteria bacterium]
MRLPFAWIAALLVATAAEADVAGVVRCAGGDTMLPLVRTWAQGFSGLHPGASVEARSDVRLSADGFAALLAGEADVATFVREPFPAEFAAFRGQHGYELSLLRVARGSFATRGGTHALAVFVNADNPLQQLTLTQLDALLSAAPRRGAGPTLRHWGELGLRGRWRDRPIHVYGMLHVRNTGNPPGIVNFLQQRVLLGAPFRADLEEQRDAPGESALQAIVRHVASDQLGIGYSGFAFARAGVKSLALAETAAGPFVAGSVEAVAAGTYPLSRDLYLGFDRRPGQPLQPLLRAFLRYALSPAGQQAIRNTPAHFLPLSPREVAEALRELE